MMMNFESLVACSFTSAMVKVFVVDLATFPDIFHVNRVIHQIATHFMKPRGEGFGCGEDTARDEGAITVLFRAK
jgi:hypothetical protein